jgi:hypothetical protein
MTWKELESAGRAAPHRTSRRELDDLREAVQRNLHDAAVPGISADNSFGMAYEGALLACKMTIACSGYRIKGPGAHQASFVALELAMGEDEAAAAKYFERCQRKRNDISYERAGIVSQLEAKEILDEAVRLRDRVETWIAKRYAAQRKK